uniref:Putative secreted protein n=1 Tax=Anopheles darlingi TaxID=43151 RepID=A0A2M4DBJ1_ANODA
MFFSQNGMHLLSLLRLLLSIVLNTGAKLQSPSPYSSIVELCAFVGGEEIQKSRPIGNICCCIFSGKSR